MHAALRRRRGADTAFERGAREAGGLCEIFLPWPRFNDHDSPLNRVSTRALALAATIHPAWARPNDAARRLHARNCYQVLGAALDHPSRFLVCWTGDGAETEAQCGSRTGGTRTAIILAARSGVPVFNLANHDAMERLGNLLESTGRRPCWQLA